MRDELLTSQLRGDSGATPPPAAKSIWVPGLTLSILAIALRILVATRREGIEVDGIIYLQNAEALWKDWTALDVLHPPLYSILLAPFLGLWRDFEWGARVLSAVLGGLWVWPTMWLSRATTDQRVQWGAGLLVALIPAGVEASTRVLAEATYGLCLTASLTALARTLSTGNSGLALVAGALGGLATLARPEGFTYLLLACGVLLCTPVVFQPKWSRWRAASAILGVSLSWLLVLAPYSMLVWQRTGHWHWSGKMGITLAWGESVGQEQPALFIDHFLSGLRQDQLPTGFLGYMLAHPQAMLQRVAINLHHVDKYALPGLLPTAALIFVGIGLFGIRWRRTLSHPEWFLVAALLPAAGTLFFLSSTRYFVPLLPVLSVIAAIGLARMGHPAEGSERRGLSPGARILLAVVLISFVPWLIRPWYRHDPAGVEKSAAQWLLHTSGPGTVFIGRHPRVTFYAGAHQVPLATRTLEDLVREGQRNGAQFLIVDNIDLPDLRPDLLPLVGGDPGYHRNLELAHVEEDRSGNRVVIYRIRNPAMMESRQEAGPASGASVPGNSHGYTFRLSEAK